MTLKTNEQPPAADTDPQGPIWDPVAQIYVGGQLPENAQVQQVIHENEGSLPVFGYGSLCWKPGGILGHPSVTSKLGKARGYRRCWAQKSTDHRGEPRFPGIVCTLLKDEEVAGLRGTSVPDEESLTEGVLYMVPPELVQECLAELDFREKGGYARDVIEVLEDDTGKTMHSLLYRGTPDNPAIWQRAIRDLPFAAAILSVAHGPSGRNDEYLNNLNSFLEHAADVSTLEKFDDTIRLAAMVHQYQKYTQLFFLFGAGSNQHNQLLLKSPTNAARLVNGEEDAHEIKEILLCVPKEHEINGDEREVDAPQQVFAGGGHSALLTKRGRLYLFGWNDRGQSGKPHPTCLHDSISAPVDLYCGLEELRVETCALGFEHNLLIERDTGHLWAMGDNSRGQVNGEGSLDFTNVPMRVPQMETDKFVDVACGLHHSAAVADSGDVVVFGCGRFGQCLSSEPSSEMVWNGRWRPHDGSKLLKVACGRRHTIVLDDRGRLFSFGDNKYGQLGRRNGDSEIKRDSQPQQVFGPWESEGFTICDIRCGWSHTVVQAQKKNSEGRLITRVYGFGRNDKGQLGQVQLGLDQVDQVRLPASLFSDHSSNICSVTCGSEFTIVVDENNDIWGCGWNEHGNLAQNHDKDSIKLSKLEGATITNPPGNPANTVLSVAAGGAHVLAIRAPPC